MLDHASHTGASTSMLRRAALRLTAATGLLTLVSLGTTTSAAAQVLETTFAGGNGFAGNMFDATVASNTLRVTGLDVHMGGFGGPGDGAGFNALISVFGRVGGYSGFETDAGSWSLLSQTNAISNGVGTRTFVDVTDFFLSANTTYGLYVTVSNYDANAGGRMIYTNAIGTVTYGNSDLDLSLGIGTTSPDFSGGIANRIWNGAIYYSVVPTSVPEPASFALIALGLGGLAIARRRRTA